MNEVLIVNKIVYAATTTMICVHCQKTYKAIYNCIWKPYT